MTTHDKAREALEKIAAFAPGNGEECEIFAKIARAALAASTPSVEPVGPDALREQVSFFRKACVEWGGDKSADNYQIMIAEQRRLFSDIDALAAAPKAQAGPQLGVGERQRFAELIRQAMKSRIDDGRKALSFTPTEWECIANALAAPEAPQPKAPPSVGDGRCPLCRYQHGHQIGCEKNPLDIALRAGTPTTPAVEPQAVPAALTDAIADFPLPALTNFTELEWINGVSYPRLTPRAAEALSALSVTVQQSACVTPNGGLKFIHRQRNGADK